MQRSEPLQPTPLPELPWQKLGVDLFEWKKAKYLLVVDYYSRFIEIAKLSGESSGEVIKHLKSIMARHGIPEQIMSDNGPQFAAAEFDRFSKEYGFSHKTSSPQYPQSNGEAERAVQTVKQLLKKAEDPYQALLVYRASPLQNGYSPAELLMSRRLRTTLTTISAQLQPSIPNSNKLQEKEAKMKSRQKDHFDRRHRAKSEITCGSLIASQMEQ